MPAIDVLRLNHSMTFLPGRKWRPRHHSPLPVSGSSRANPNGWDGWGRLCDDGPGHYNPDPSDLMMVPLVADYSEAFLVTDEQLRDALHCCCKVRTILFVGYLEVTPSLGMRPKHTPLGVGICDRGFFDVVGRQLRRLRTSLARSALRLPPQRREPSRQALKTSLDRCDDRG